MPIRMNREAYEKLIAENLEWLEKQPRTLEREHVIQIVRQSPDREYGDTAKIADLEAELFQYKAKVQQQDSDMEDAQAKLAILSGALEYIAVDINMDGGKGYAAIERAKELAAKEIEDAKR